MKQRATIREGAGWLLLVGILLANFASAQSASRPADNGFKLPKKEQRLSSFDALMEFNQPSPAVYIYGEGDEIAIDVWGHPELSGKQVIGPDGQITLPVAGSVKLAGLSREEGRNLVADSYAQYYVGLSVEVRVEAYTSNRIFILGRVSQFGVLHFDVPPTLLEAITRAGALPVGGLGAEKAALNRCIIFRGRDKVVWVDLKPLLKQGNLSYNLQLQRNDILYLPDSDDQSVYVLGEVQHPGAVHLRADMTFMDALAEAGGPTKDGVANHIQLVRPSAELKRTVSLRNVMTPDPTLNVVLADGDIIYVPKKGVAQFGYILNQFAPASGLALMGMQLVP
jgi:polysaccharide export outer membrane protein